MEKTFGLRLRASVKNLNYILVRSIIYYYTRQKNSYSDISLVHVAFLISHKTEKLDACERFLK